MTLTSRINEEFQRQIFQKNITPMIVVDVNNTILEINEAFSERFGFDSSIVGSSAQKYVVPENRKEETKVFFDDIQQQKPLKDFETIRLTKDGKEVPVSITAFPLEQENVYAGICVMYRDNSEIYTLKELLKEQTELAKKREQTAHNFLQNMHHEVRTPLNGMLGFIELLEDSIQKNKRQIKEFATENENHLLSRLFPYIKSKINPSETSEVIEKLKNLVDPSNYETFSLIEEECGEIEQYLSTIKKSGDTLLNLISNIIELTELKSGNRNIRTSEINSKEFIKNIYHSLEKEDEFQKERVLLTYNIDPSVPHKIAVDATTLEKTIRELTSNSAKFTDEGLVKINVSSYVQDSNDYLQIVVEDTGIGIPQEDLNKIIEAFNKVQGTAKSSYLGAGVGLTIVDELIKLNGGSLELESIVNKGTKATVRLPYSRVQEVIPTKNYLDYTILVAEDDSTNKDLFKAQLKLMGFPKEKVLFASNGAEAVRMYQKHKENMIVIMDYKMPIKDGVQAAKEIVAYDPQAIIIGCTAYTEEKSKLELLHAGCKIYISKPITKERLISGLEDALK